MASSGQEASKLKKQADWRQVTKPANIVIKLEAEAILSREAGQGGN